MSRLCAQLSNTAPVWRKLVAPWAEYVARALWTTTSQSKVPATRLTQQHKREAKGGSQLPPPVPTSRHENLCRGCGKSIRAQRTHCGQCAIDGAKQRLIDAARIGRQASRSPAARAKQKASRRRHAEACSAWDPASQPTWLTSEVYTQKIQPVLAKLSTSVIGSRIGVSRAYAGRIRDGYRPHPRHWQALAELVSVSNPLS
jgi:hypothetical protein